MKGIIFTALLLLSTTLWAASDTPVSLDISQGNLTAQRADIMKAIGGKEYSELAEADRLALYKLLDAIEQNPSAAEQNLANQKRANDILAAGYADSRMICRQVKEIGSNMSKRSCMTVAAKRRAAEKAKFDTATPIRIN